MKTKEEILIEFGCPNVPFDENVTMYYPAILSAMEEYANAKINEAMRKSCTENKILKEKITRLKFMIDNGLGWKDMENDISPMHEL